MTTRHAIAALLLVAMAATPVTSIACVGWCFPAEGPTSTACHHATATLVITAGEANCDTVLAISPFIKEEIQPNTQAVLPTNTVLHLLAGAAGEALLAAGRDVDPAASRRATSPLVLRL